MPLLPKSVAFRLLLLFLISFIGSRPASAQTDSIVLRDIAWDRNSPASMSELAIPSDSALLAGFIYKANGPGKHPTLLLLHGYPGNERNLDLAQVVRAHGWNVIYFDYTGSWGSQGRFSFRSCVRDVVNVVGFCKKNSDLLQVDTSNIVLFGHSMGGWICLKALEELPGIRKGFALSTWNIYGDFKNVRMEKLDAAIAGAGIPRYFVLNASPRDIFSPVLIDPGYYDLANGAKALAQKQLVMLDEHKGNAALAEALKAENRAFFSYDVWATDHPFTNKRVALMKKLIEFLDR